MFEIAQKVVYGAAGVCEIVDIATPPISGVEGDYYYLQPIYDNKGIIYSPVDSKVFMRDIMTMAECDGLYTYAVSCKENPMLNESVSPAEYDNILKSQEPMQLIHLIRCLYNVKNSRAKDMRKMKAADSRALMTARKLLYGEIAVVSQKDVNEVTKEFDALLSSI